MLSSQTHITIDDRCCLWTNEVPPFAPCQSLAEPPGSPQYMNALYGHMPPPLGMGWSSKVWWNWDPSRFRQRCNEMRANREKIEKIIILVDIAYYNRITQVPYIIHVIHALWQKGRLNNTSGNTSPYLRGCWGERRHRLAQHHVAYWGSDEPSSRMLRGREIHIFSSLPFDRR